ncbi:S8 family serine peptidase [Halanaerobiaceae bacterium Z-7014]|uniref:S8 family serine peptidase n=1 Tax=Halonatronomonas betaini TaxID=2778430 RepID=A0A931AW16_9FIRM|nr:S8 family serine peptidase [Halonatronomonas betaini]MBF8437146.1 S8 family serine peptidase [Halonatronomonas betaini]
MKKILILLLALALIFGSLALYYELQRGEEKPVIVYIIDASFNPMFGPTNRIQRPDDYRLRPGHGQLVREIIESSAGTSNLIIREREIQPISQAERRQQFEEFLQEIYFEQIVNQNKRVLINISLAFMDGNQVEEELFQNLKDMGITTIAAAGNSGDDYLYYPASYEGTFSITSGSRRGLADYATYNNRVDLAASGDVVRYLPGRMSSFQTITYRQAGTSFAAPRVTGLLAGILSRSSKDYSGEELIEIAKDNARIINDSISLISPNRLLYNTDNKFFWRQLYLRGVLILFAISIFPSWYLIKYKRLLIRYRNINSPEKYFVYFNKLNIKEAKKVKETIKESFEDKFDFNQFLDFLRYWLLKKKEDPEKLADKLLKHAPDYTDNLTNDCTFFKFTNEIESTASRNKIDQFSRFWLEILKQKEEWNRVKRFTIDNLETARDPWLIYYFLVTLIDLREQSYLSADEVENINNKLERIKKKDDPLIKESLILWYNKIE